MEEDCQVGSEGKPNNSKISPDTKKRKKQFEKNDHRSGSFKLNKSLRLSLVTGEARSSEKEEEKITIKAASIMKSGKT